MKNMKDLSNIDICHIAHEVVGVRCLWCDRIIDEKLEGLICHPHAEAVAQVYGISSTWVIKKAESND